MTLSLADFNPSVRHFIRRISLYANFFFQRYKRTKEDLSNDPVATLCEMAKSKQDMFVLGDSVYERISAYDTDRRSLSRMIEDMAKGSFDVRCISYSAYHLSVYYLLIIAAKIIGIRPAILVIPINMRSFSPQWDMNPLFRCSKQVNKLLNFIRMHDRTKLPELYGSDGGISIRTYINSEAEFLKGGFRTVSDFIDIIYSKPETEEEREFRYGQIFTYHYLYSLGQNHPKLRILKDIIHMTRKDGINVFLYITPINYQAGLRYVGNDFLNLFSTNIGVVRDCIFKAISLELAGTVASRESNVMFCDLSARLDNEHFFSEHESTEHLNEKGRAFLAGTIIREIALFRE